MIQISKPITVEQAYRGYLIRVSAVSKTMWIEKDGHCIHTIPPTESWAYARKCIDEIT